MHLELLLMALTAADAHTAAERFEWGRVSSLTDWLLPLLVLAALAALTIFNYRRDCRELGARPAVLLSSLRLTALLMLLAIWMQPQWRASKDVIDRSRAILLVDTSQSMDRRDADSGGSAASSAESRSRSEAVIEELESGALAPQLRQLHDVAVYGFDEGEKPALLAALPYQGTGPSRPTAEPAVQKKQRQVLLAAHRRWFAASIGLGVVGLILIGAYLFRPAAKGTPPPWLAVAGLTCVAAAVGLAIWTARAPQSPSLLTLLGLSGQQGSSPEKNVAAEKPSAPAPNWRDLLTPRGKETRLGQAVFQLAIDQRSAPVSGMIVLSDGGQNAGTSMEDAIAAATDSRIPVHPIGLGSRQQQSAARWISYDAHERVLPGDPFEVKARLRAVGLAGRSVTARLRQVPLSESGKEVPAPEISLDQQQEVLIAGPAEDLVVNFLVPGIKNAGRYGLQMSVEGRGAASDPADSLRRFQVEVVDRKTKVLLIAGGPGREFRFLRGVLRRDKRVDLSVWLQSSAVEKAKDDYPRILNSFPENKDELHEFDCMVALDPDWSVLSENQAALLADWVADQAGGLIVVPGRVYAGSAVQNWLADPNLAKLRALYPVEFMPVLFQADDVGRKWNQVRPIDLTREGMEADFLRLDDNPLDSQRIWTTQFDGVYGTLPVRGAKPGASVLARHIDPEAQAAGIDPVFLAEQFFGSGRVFYVGSGELWRLRQVDEGHFERFYTQLIDHVSKQRLQRGSRRGGMLLLERNEYHVGDNVPLAADLKDAQDKPLETDSVTLYVHAPGIEQPSPVKLLPNRARQGMYVGQLVVKREGDYRLELPLPQETDAPLVKTVKVTTAAREGENPQRNDDLLRTLARGTGGQYYVGLESALGRQSEAPVHSLLKDRTQTTPVLGDKNPHWEAYWARFAMFFVCGALALEWLLRRLLRLA